MTFEIFAQPIHAPKWDVRQPRLLPIAYFSYTDTVEPVSVADIRETSRTNIGRGFHFDGKNLVSLFHYEIYFRISLRIWVSPIAGFDSLSYQLLTYVLFYERALEFGKELRLVHQSIHVETGQCAQYARVFQIDLERVKTLISGQRNMQSIEAGDFGNDSVVRQPSERFLIFAGAGSLPDNTVSEFAILLGKL